MEQHMRALPVKMAVERLDHVLNDGIATLYCIECEGALHVSQHGGILEETLRVRWKEYGATQTFSVMEMRTARYLACTSWYIWQQCDRAAVRIWG